MPLQHLCHAIAVIAIALVPSLSAAHGLLLDADSDGTSIFGSAYYTNGEKAVHESIALLDLSTPGAAAARATTDAEGNFRFDVVASHRYRVAVYGEEGHSVEVELVAGSEATPQLVDTDAPTAPSYWPPPAWAIIGGALLLSLIPVAMGRKRGR